MKKIIKYILVIVLMLGMVITITGCGKKNKDAKEYNKENEIAQSNQAENNSNGDVEETKNETQDTDNTVSKNETKQDKKSNKAQQDNNEAVNAIKKCLKDEIGLKKMYH